tara:strand:- start:342 stop:539 length:198 start_codon:yes stop_codon:yes gene_type:complete
MQFSLFIFVSKVLTVVLSTIQINDFSKLPSAVGVVQRLPTLSLCAEQLVRIKNKHNIDNVFIVSI